MQNAAATLALTSMVLMVANTAMASADMRRARITIETNEGVLHVEYTCGVHACICMQIMHSARR